MKAKKRLPKAARIALIVCAALLATILMLAGLFRAALWTGLPIQLFYERLPHYSVDRAAWENNASMSMDGLLHRIDGLSVTYLYYDHAPRVGTIIGVDVVSGLIKPVWAREPCRVFSPYQMKVKDSFLTPKTTHRTETDRTVIETLYALCRDKPEEGRWPEDNRVRFGKCALFFDLEAKSGLYWDGDDGEIGVLPVYNEKNEVIKVEYYLKTMTPEFMAGKERKPVFYYYRLDSLPSAFAPFCETVRSVYRV